MTSLKVYRHGDITFTKITKKTLPNTLQPKSKIIAEGETTGHYHAFVESSLVNCFIDTVSQTQYVEIPEVGIIDHPEHGIMEIPKGVYKVRTSRELDLLGEIKKTLD